MEALLSVPANDDREGKRNRAILELLYSTGLRVSELVALNVEDFAEGGGEGGTLRILGKGRKERLVVYGSAAMNAVHNLFFLCGRNSIRKGGWLRRSRPFF